MARPSSAITIPDVLRFVLTAGGFGSILGAAGLYLALPAAEAPGTARYGLTVPPGFTRLTRETPELGRAPAFARAVLERELVKEVLIRTGTLDAQSHLRVEVEEGWAPPAVKTDLPYVLLGIQGDRSADGFETKVLKKEVRDLGGIPAFEVELELTSPSAALWQRVIEVPTGPRTYRMVCTAHARSAPSGFREDAQRWIASFHTDDRPSLGPLWIPGVLRRAVSGLGALGGVALAIGLVWNLAVHRRRTTVEVVGPAATPPITRTAGEADLRRPFAMTAIAVVDYLGGFALLLGGIALGAAMVKTGRGLLGLGGMAALGLGLFAILAGASVWQLRPQAARLQLGLALLALPVLPVGTIAGILLIVYLTRPGVHVLLSGRGVGNLSPDETAAVQRLRGLGTAVVAVLVLSGATSLLSVFFAGTIAAIAVPSLKVAADGARQNRTVGDLERASNALEKYAIDHNRYPEATTFEDLVRVLAPFAPGLPPTDGWGHPYKYERFADGGVAVGSSGADGTWEKTSLADYAAAESRDPAADIVYRDGQPVTRPAPVTP